MRYIGVDFHKATSYITTTSEEGKVLSQFEIENTPDKIAGWVSTLGEGDKVAVEAVGHWMYLYERLEDSPARFYLSHPQATKAIAAARLKNDKVDSAMLAHLLRTNLLPEAYVPPREVRDLRELLRLRAFLVHMRTRVKNRIRSILLKTGHPCPYTNILGVKAMEFCRSLELRDSYRLALSQMLFLGQHFNDQLEKLDRGLNLVARETPEARRLMTMPGIGLYSALLILSEIGEIERFRKAGQLVSWGGLAPGISQSSHHVKRGPITKRGSKFLRWILIEDAHHAIKGARRFRNKYESVLKRRGHNKAKTAVAASMLRSIHWMLTYKEEFKDI